MATSVLNMCWLATPSDGIGGGTLDTQLEVEKSISQLLATHQTSFIPPTLDTEHHLEFLNWHLEDPFPRQWAAFDASRPWLLYWVLHSFALLKTDVEPEIKARVVATLASCQNRNGGFGGGPGQLSHLAPTYAAVLALAYVGEEGFTMVDRRAMYNFILSLKQPDGSFIMHRGGEVDVRGCYCALTVATLLNILTPALAQNTSEFVTSCQTYEGGLASSSHPFAASSPHSALAPPLGEAHGGYAFCAAATYILLRAFDSPSSPVFSTSDSQRRDLNLQSLTRWACAMQAMPIEGGGFRGRTNKLVDGCYGWWGGGIFGILGALLDEEAGEDVGELYDRSALQEYILFLAQGDEGGLRDKPGKNPDAYHTCYNLSGLASAQHRVVMSPTLVAELREAFVSPFDAKVVAEDEKEIETIKDEGESEKEAEKRMREVWARSLGWEAAEKIIVGGAENEVADTHPIFNLTRTHSRAMLEYFYVQAFVPPFSA